MTKTLRTSLLFAAMAVLPVLAALWIVSFEDYAKFYDNHLMDIRLYAKTSAQWFSGMWPYRDFPLEYPPFALAAFALPRALAFGADISERTYIRLFLLQNLAFAALIVWMVSSLLPAGQKSRALRGMALLLVISSPIWPWRYDMFPALLTMAGMYCLLRRKSALAGVWLGLGIAAKLYPVVALLGCAAWLAGQKQWKPLVRLALAATVAATAVTLPFILQAPQQWLTFLEYHRARGLQIESPLGGLVELGGLLGLTTVKPTFNYGAFHLISNWADIALRLQLPLFAIVTGACLYLLWRRFRIVSEATNAQDLAEAVLVMLLAFIVTNKVFSAQYVVWLLPFVPLIEYKMIARFIVMFALTMAIFPYLYGPLVMAMPAAVIVLNARNLLAVTLIGTLLRTRNPLRQALPQLSAKLQPTEVPGVLSR